MPPTTYLLRTIPPTLWARVKGRADADGRTARDILIDLLELYADHGLPRRPPFRSPRRPRRSSST